MTRLHLWFLVWLHSHSDSYYESYYDVPHHTLLCWLSYQTQRKAGYLLSSHIVVTAPNNTVIWSLQQFSKFSFVPSKMQNQSPTPILIRYQFLSHKQTLSHSQSSIHRQPLRHWIALTHKQPQSQRQLVVNAGHVSVYRTRPLDKLLKMFSWPNTAHVLLTQYWTWPVDQILSTFCGWTTENNQLTQYKFSQLNTEYGLSTK